MPSTFGNLKGKHKPEDYAKAIELRLKGLTYREIGVLMGFSRQRAQQLTLPPKGMYMIVKKRAEGRCEDCKVPIDHGQLHHIKKQENYNDLSNLAYLCCSCHKIRHVRNGDHV